MRPLKAILWLTLIGAAAVGCQKPFFMTEQDYVYYNSVSGDYEHRTYEDAFPVPPGAPRTVRNPDDRIEWKLTLEESKRLALANNKQIAFLGYQPGEAGTAIESALAAFDANFELGGSWGRTDQQVANSIQIFGTGQNAILQDLFGQQAAQGAVGSMTDGGATNPGATSGALSGAGAAFGGDLLGLQKRNAVGGTTRISYGLDYNKTDPASTILLVNPAWTSAATLGVVQPLASGFGAEFNRSPILIARAQHEQAIKQFQTNVHTLLRDVENAYWQLYFTYQDLYSREVGMKQGLATWQKEKNKFEIGTGAISDVAQAKEQLEFFRAARLQALQRVLDAERTLRQLMGLPPDDDRWIVPKDDPTLAEYNPQYQVGIMEAMDLRPELAAQRYLVRQAELQHFQAKNGLQPDLSVFATYRITGLADEWTDSVDTLTDTDFESWFVGFRYRRPLGERAAHASTSRFRLALSREQHTLRSVEHDIIHEIHTAYQNLITNFDLINVQKDRRHAAADQLMAREQQYLQGAQTIDVLLQSQTTFADALRDESQAIALYNQALVQWEFVRGTILANDNVVIAEEEVSRVKDKLRRQRANQWARGLPLPIHRGDRVSENLVAPDDSGPLYPEYLLTDPDEKKTSAEVETKTGKPTTPAPKTQARRALEQKPSSNADLTDAANRVTLPPVTRNVSARRSRKPALLPIELSPTKR